MKESEIAKQGDKKQYDEQKLPEVQDISKRVTKTEDLPIFIKELFIHFVQYL